MDPPCPSREIRTLFGHVNYMVASTKPLQSETAECISEFISSLDSVKTNDHFDILTDIYTKTQEAVSAQKESSSKESSSDEQ
jgi:hypothetical protein